MTEQFYLTYREEPNRYCLNSQGGFGSNSDEGVLYTPQTSRTGDSPSDVIKSHTQNKLYLEMDLHP